MSVAANHDEPGVLVSPGADVQYSETGLSLDPGMRIERWLEVGSLLNRLSRSMGWLIGDWLNFGAAVYGETYAQGMDMTGLSYKTVANYKWVAGHVPQDLRREALSWEHHKEVASMSVTDQEIWLDVAEREDLTRDEFRERIKSGTPDLPRPPQPQWSSATSVVGDPTTGITVNAVREALSEAIELTEMPLVELDPATLEQHKKKFVKVLNTVELAQRVVYEEHEPEEAVSQLRTVAERAQVVVENRGKSGLGELREALRAAGYLPHGSRPAE